MSKNKNKIINLAILLVFVVILIEGFTLLGGGSYFGNRTLEAWAEEVIESCKESNHKSSCYDEEIPKLMDHISYEEAFEVTRIIQNQDPNYWYCHVLGHNLSARETAKDPSKWMDVVARSPSGICSNGAIHGAFQERFRVEVLSLEQIEEIIPDLKRVCEPREGYNPTGLEQASCYHALGHLTMYMTGAETRKSLSTCDRITSNFKQMCYDGVFMQIYQPLEPEDFALVVDIAPKSQGESDEFCQEFKNDDFTYSTCIRESWPLWRKEISTSEGVMAFCSRTPSGVERNRCYNAVFYVNAPQVNFNKEKMIEICTGLPTDVKARCFANFASRMIETDYRLSSNSVSLCQKAQEEGVGDRCYQELAFYAQFNYHPGSEESISLCKALPDDWRERCLNGDVRALEF